MIAPRLLKVWTILLVVVFFAASTLFALLGTPISISGGAGQRGWLDPVFAGAITAIGSSPIAFVLCAIKTGTKVGMPFDESRCPSCDYDLSGLKSDQCPECGRSIDQQKGQGQAQE